MITQKCVRKYILSCKFGMTETVLMRYDRNCGNNYRRLVEKVVVKYMGHHAFFKKNTIGHLQSTRGSMKGNRIPFERWMYFSKRK